MPRTCPGARDGQALFRLKPAPKRRLAVSLRLGCLSRSKSILVPRRLRVATGPYPTRFARPGQAENSAGRAGASSTCP